jgi:hypothetical protein
MKKFFSFLVLVLMAITTVNAQSIKDEVAKSQERAEKLQKLCDGFTTFGNAGIDGYGNSVKAAAFYAIENTNKLQNLYKREIGETKDGVQDVTIKKPSLDEWLTLSETILKEGDKIQEAVDKAKDAAEGAKNMAQEAASIKNPMKAPKAMKNAKAASAVVEFGNAATPILLEESAAQAKAIGEIINTLKSGGNL